LRKPSYQGEREKTLPPIHSERKRKSKIKNKGGCSDVLPLLELTERYKSLN